MDILKDLLEEVKCWIILVVIFFFFLVYVMFLISSLVWINLFVVIFVLVVLCCFFFEVEIWWKFFESECLIILNLYQLGIYDLLFFEVFYVVVNRWCY